MTLFPRARGKPRADRRIVCALALAVAAGPVTAASQQLPQPPATTTPDTATAPDGEPALLHHAVWEAGVLGRTVSGRAAWLRGRAGELRLEILAEPRDGRADHGAAHVTDELLRRQGEGWTFTASGTEAVTAGGDGPLLKPWGARWREAPAALATLLEQVVERVEAGPPVPDPRRDGERRTAGWRRPGLTATGAARVELPRLSPEMAVAVPTDDEAPPPLRAPRGCLRRDLVQRGRGRGADAEIVTFRWAGGQIGEPRLVVTSSRRTGSVALRHRGAQPVRHPGWETFVPVWPLADLIESP
ncbi:MAG: hypothetical protein R6X25_01510 [Candidatus Krumholzibacteriia bacterium]